MAPNVGRKTRRATPEAHSGEGRQDSGAPADRPKVARDLTSGRTPRRNLFRGIVTGEAAAGSLTVALSGRAKMFDPGSERDASAVMRPRP